MVVQGNNEVTLPKYEESSSDLVRDRIVIIGRQGAGKTVYLSLLYELLWKSNNKLSMKALDGQRHREFMKTAKELRAGKWPESTSGNRRTHIEISYKKQNLLMVALDYSGELINKAFVSEDGSPESKELQEHLDQAGAVILLIDPAQVVGHNASIDSSIENDFGIVQAMNRLKNWPDGNDVPIVLVFTKIDETYSLLKEHGGTKSFCHKFFPRLISTAEHLKVCKISAVQTNNRHISSDFDPQNLELPLCYCLDLLLDREKDKKFGKELEQCRKTNIEKLKRKIRQEKIIRWAIIVTISIPVIITFIYVIIILWPRVLDKWILGY